MHVVPSVPLYCEEARNRMYFYPPTLPPDGYYLRWLWLDGMRNAGYEYLDWESKIVDRMNQPALVTITMWGDYNPTIGNGMIYAQFRNDSSATLDGRVYFVITEDSIYYPSPNGDTWHNHVAREYLPTDIGTLVSIPAGDSITISQPFEIHPDWNATTCEIVAWIQDTIIQADSTIEIWQGGITKFSEFGIREESDERIPFYRVKIVPNPCTNGTNFVFQLPKGTGYHIDLFDVVGRRIRMLKGVASGTSESIRWTLRGDKGSLVGAGVYLYRFESKIMNTTGKIVIME